MRGKAGMRRAVWRAVRVAAFAALAGASVCGAQGFEEEVVANLATGRVLINVSKDGIVVAALQDRAEAGSQAPVFMQMGSRRMAIFLGAVEWLFPSSGAEPIRMDTALETVMRDVRGSKPGTLTDASESDLEQIGLGLLEHLKEATGKIHHNLEMGEDEPLLEVVLVGHIEGYGPEVWTLSYRIRQDALRGSFWRTRVLRPRYVQLYPPEKGEPRRLIEVRYPEDGEGGSFAEMLSSDARLAGARNADPQLANGLLGGESHKLEALPVSEWLRGAMNAISAKDARQVLGVITEKTGVAWELEPAERIKQLAQEEEEKKPAGAPTLRKP